MGRKESDYFATQYLIYPSCQNSWIFFWFLPALHTLTIFLPITIFSLEQILGLSNFYNDKAPVCAQEQDVLHNPFLSYINTVKV